MYRSYSYSFAFLCVLVQCFPCFFCFQFGRREFRYVKIFQLIGWPRFFFFFLMLAPTFCVLTLLDQLNLIANTSCINCIYEAGIVLLSEKKVYPSSLPSTSHSFLQFLICSMIISLYLSGRKKNLILLLPITEAEVRRRRQEVDKKKR